MQAYLIPPLYYFRCQPPGLLIGLPIALAYNNQRIGKPTVNHEYPPRKEIEILADEISRYLSQHQFAADTVEGICEWWITRQRIEEEQKRVLLALDYLIKHHKVSSRRLPDGSLIYSALDIENENIEKH